MVLLEAAAEADVGLGMATQSCHLGRKLTGKKKVVAVEVLNEGAASQAKGLLSGEAWATWSLVTNQLNAAHVAIHKVLRKLRSVIAGAIIDDDDFCGRMILRQNRLHRLGQQSRAVADRDQGADQVWRWDGQNFNHCSNLNMSTQTGQGLNSLCHGAR